MNRNVLLCTLIGMSLLAACGAIGPQPVAATVAAATTAAAAPASPTPDPCLPQNLPGNAAVVNNYIRQFDNYASLASVVAQSELIKVIPAMQAIQRDAQAQDIPVCLTDLKHYELLYMDTTIRTLLAFQSNSQTEDLSVGILQARQYHDQYVAELAHVTGVTLPAPTPTVVAQATPAPAATATAAAATVINPGPNPLNLHVSASLTAETIATLNANESATALARSATGEWIQIEIPGQAGKDAWVFASLVQFTSGSLAGLPVAAP